MSQKGKKQEIISCTSSSSSTWYKRNKTNDIGDVVHGKRKPIRNVISPQFAKVAKLEREEKQRNIDKYASNIVDLTMLEEKYDLLGTPSLFKVRNMNREWFSYDPSGYTNRKELPTDYCNKCRCPKEYCADLVFGDDCVNYTNREVLMKEGKEGISLEGIAKVFKKKLHGDGI
jgi:hypothetical protein